MSGSEEMTLSPQSGRNTVSAARVLIWLSVLLPLSLFLAAAWYDRAGELKLAEERVAATTDTLAEHAKSVLQSVDLVLYRVADRVEGKSWGEIRASQDLHRFLATLRESLPQVESIFLVAPDGVIAASSRSFPAPVFNAGEREYFKGAADRKGLFVSEPFRGQTSGTFAFTMSRPLSRDGGFNGVVAVTVYPGYFEGFYRAVLERPNASTAALVRVSDGSLLIRFPQTGKLPQKLPRTSPLLRAAASGDQRGVYQGVSSIDGKTRISGFARLDAFGLTVNYNLDSSAVLARWYANITLFAVFAALAGVALFVTARLTLAHALRQEENLRLLIAETERRQEAEAKLQHVQKMEALGRLTGGVAHDFNNLLAAILGGIDLARKRIDDPNAVRLLGMASEAAQRGAKLTQQMLAFSRKQDVEPRSIDPGAVLRGMDELLRRTIGGLIRIRYEFADDSWPVLADPVQLEVALLNLAVNAKDAMPAGGDLTISIRNLGAAGVPPALGLPGGDYVVVAVKDTGDGMSDEVKRRAFEPFFTTKGPTHGTGLGLSMIFGFATKGGGAATIDSAPGKGATVSLFLPRASAGATAPEIAEGRGSGASRHVCRILVVDDNAVVRNVTREMLEELGHTVGVAESGSEGLALLSEAAGDFDLLIADYAMPSMNGSQLATEAAKIRPDLPVLFMTGYVEHDALRPWLELGYHLLDKPFSAKDLETAVQAATGAKRKARALLAS
jgi:two-component system NtrC family sensor kinase